jgi:hypothetical protein
MFNTERKSYYEYIGSTEDRRSNTGFNYEGRILEKTMSSITLGGDASRKNILESIEKVVFRLIETTKNIRNFVNYRVPKNNKYVR